MRKRIVFTVFVSMLLFSAIAFSGMKKLEAEGMPLMYVDPPALQVAVNEDFLVNVSVANVTNMKGFDFMLFYNTTIFDCNRVYETPISTNASSKLPVDEHNIFHYDAYPTIDEAYDGDIGRVWVFFWGFPTFNGSGPLMTIKFTATAIGNSTLHLYHSGLYDPVSAPIDHTTLDGSVTVNTFTYVWSQIADSTSSYNNTDPSSGSRLVSGKFNMTFSLPDENGVINITIPKESNYIEPSYDPISNMTMHMVPIADAYGKIYTVNGTGDVDIISMTNDTGMFFWKDGAWHPPGEEWIGDGTPDPAGSAWLKPTNNISIYHGNGTNGLLIGSYLTQGWLTTGFCENTVDEIASRLNGSYVNATGVPFSSPFVGEIVTWVWATAYLNLPWWQGEHLDLQSKTDQMQVTPKAIMVTLFSPANLYVTDPENNHIGADPTTGEYVNEIDGAFYSGPGSHPQRIVIPDPVDGVYDIKIVGTSTGEYTLAVELATVEETITNTYTGDIAAGQILESEVNISGDEMTFTPPSSPVGGISIPVNKLALLAPYIGLTMLLAVAVISVVYVKKRKSSCASK